MHKHRDAPFIGWIDVLYTGNNVHNAITKAKQLSSALGYPVYVDFSTTCGGYLVWVPVMRETATTVDRRYIDTDTEIIVHHGQEPIMPCLSIDIDRKD